jgi:hypothetical protein
MSIKRSRHRDQIRSTVVDVISDGDNKCAPKITKNTSYIKQMPRITMYMFVLRTPLGAREFLNFSD